MGEEGSSISARDFMTSPPVCIEGSATVSDAAALMLERGVGSLVVVDENNLYKGVLTERLMFPQESMLPFARQPVYGMLSGHFGSPSELVDLINDLRKEKVADVASKNAPVVPPDCELEKVAEIMTKEGAHHLPVVDGKIPIGMISRHDFLKVYLIIDD